MNSSETTEKIKIHRADQGLSPWLTFLMRMDTHRKVMVKAGITIGVIGLSVVIGLIAGRLNPLFGVALAGLPFAFIFIMVLQEKLYLTPIVILIAAGFVPLGFSTGTGSKIMLSLVFAAGFIVLWLLRRMLVDRRFSFIKTPLAIPVIGFSVTTIISLIWSILFRDPLLFVPKNFILVQLASAVIMIVSPGILLMMGNLVQEEMHLKIISWVMVSVGVLGIINNFLSLGLPVNTSGQASMWVIALAMSLALFNEKLARRWRIALLALAFAWVIWGFIFNLAWLAGWLPGFVAGYIILALRSKRLLVLAILVLVIYFFLNTSVIESWLGDETLTSGDTRVMAWEMNWKFTKDHLLFGMGPAGYAVYYMTYNPLDAMATHNNYIDLLSQTGVVGSAFYLSIFGLLLWRGWVVYNRVKGRRDFLEALVVAALGGTCGCIVIMAFGDWLLPFAYTQTIAGFSYTVYNWLFMGTIVSLDAITGSYQPGQMKNHA